MNNAYDARLHISVQELTVEVAVLKSRLETAGVSLKEQAKEYERRLGELNHAHAEARSVLQTYMPREAFDRFKEEAQIWRAGVDNTLSKDEGRRASYTSIIALVVSLSSLGVALLKYLLG